MATDVRQDIFQTSSGVGHHYRPGYYFPSSNFKSVKLEPIPATIAKPDEVSRDAIYKTTYGTAHDLKHQGGPYGNKDPYYSKAPGHWKMDYVKDLHEKLQPGGYRKPLTMGNQCTETHEQFRAQPGLSEPKEFVPNPQGFILSSHHSDGPSKQIAPTTTNEKLRGRPFYVRDKGVFDLNDPYLTTTNQHHRAFKPKELESYPKKNVATYWQCEDYPKAWGHGLKHNPVPKDSVPREQPPMRDTMVFKSATQVRRIPPKSVPVPHTGKTTEHRDNFQQPSDVKMREIYYCPVDTPYVLPAPGSRAAAAAPQMYKTEYENIGSKRPITC